MSYGSQSGQGKEGVGDRVTVVQVTLEEDHIPSTKPSLPRTGVAGANSSRGKGEKVVDVNPAVKSLHMFNSSKLMQYVYGIADLFRPGTANLDDKPGQVDCGGGQNSDPLQNNSETVRDGRKKGWKRRARTRMVIEDEVSVSLQLGKRNSSLDGRAEGLQQKISKTKLSDAHVGQIHMGNACNAPDLLNHFDPTVLIFYNFIKSGGQQVDRRMGESGVGNQSKRLWKWEGCVGPKAVPKKKGQDR
ncbi:hypothetical protein ACOSP7_014794 [Xanthoceras sorbifolium]